LLPKFGIFRVVVTLRFVLGIQVIQALEELIEAMVGRQVLVSVAEVILAELGCHVALLFQQVGDGRHPVGDAVIGARHADGQEASAKWMVAEHEGGASGCTRLFTVGIREQCPLPSNAIDVWCAVSHNAMVVGSDVRSPISSPQII
jgi:hypothetical protein